LIYSLAATFLGRMCLSGDAHELDAKQWAAVQRAAGAAVAATDAVIDGRAENAFCSVRPPGHHATRDATMLSTDDAAPRAGV